MRACVQRVSSAAVTVEGQTVGQIDRGLFVLLGVADDDTLQDAEYVAQKILGLRVFADHDGKMNLSVEEVGGGVLVVSQFTLMGDCRKGRRPSFIRAAQPEAGNQLYQRVVELLRHSGLPVATGQFGAMMDISLVNHGPVTMLIDSRKLF